MDIAGFDAAMERQREKGRESWTGAEGGRRSGDLASTRSSARRGNEFLGYGAETGEGDAARHRRQRRRATRSLREGAQAALVFDRTPFYAESGGQAGDHGVIRFANGAEFIVEDTQKQAGALHVHVGRLERRARSSSATRPRSRSITRAARSIRANHSATHLLHAALRNVLGPHVTQKGSLVEADYFRFDFSHGAAAERRRDRPRRR